MHEQEQWVELNLASDLRKAGIQIILDKWENSRIGGSVSRFVERIDKADYVVVVGTPLYRKKYENRESERGYVVAAEVDLIANRMIGTEAQKETVLPILLLGEKKACLPPLLQSRVHADFRNEADYFVTTFDLILSLYRISSSTKALVGLRDSLRNKIAVQK